MGDRMKLNLKEAYNIEMEKAIELYKLDDLDNSFTCLERAHILGQSYILPHTRSHWWMFRIGLKKRDVREVVGQLTRMIASVLFSKIWVPLGNTGGANVNPLKPMPIPKDLQEILDEVDDLPTEDKIEK